MLKIPKQNSRIFLKKQLKLNTVVFFNQIRGNIMSESNQIAKKLLINRNSLKVVRLCLAPGEVIPEHSTNADVVVTVVKGKGIFTINGVSNAINQGDVLDLQPKIPHAITARDELELIVVHMHLTQQKTEISCGAEACSHN